MTGSGRISVAMATYNGDQFLERQLESILAQRHEGMEIVVCDDGSTDRTPGILERYASEGKLRWFANSPNLGTKLNFGRALGLTTGDYVAFSDQDDVWLDHKLEVTLARFRELEQRFGATTPMLVFTDLVLVDQNLSVRAPSFYQFMGRDPCLTQVNRLLMGNIVWGCGAVANRALVDLALPIPACATMHDGWFALVASALGMVSYVNTPTVLYRQHARNFAGVRRTSPFEKVRQFLVKGLDRQRFRSSLILPRYPQARELLTRYQKRMAPETASLVERFLRCGEMGAAELRYAVVRNGFLRHSVWDNVELMVRL